MQGALDEDFSVQLGYVDPFHLEVKYSEADNEFQMDFNRGEETTAYAIDVTINEVALSLISGEGGMEVNFAGVTHEGAPIYV